MSSIKKLVYRIVTTGTIAATLAACSGNTAGNFVRSTGLGPTTAQTQEFVVRSRPGEVDYIPIHAPGGTVRTTPAKTAAEVKAVEEEMDNLRERNASAGAAAAETGGTPPPDPVLIPVKKRNSKASTNTTTQ